MTKTNEVVVDLSAIRQHIPVKELIFEFLIAYETQNGKEPSIEEIRQFMGKHLPETDTFMLKTKEHGAFYQSRFRDIKKYAPRVAKLAK